jgi:hypothetical protein
MWAQAMVSDKETAMRSNEMAWRTWAADGTDATGTHRPGDDSVDTTIAQMAAYKAAHPTHTPDPCDQRGEGTWTS